MCPNLLYSKVSSYPVSSVVLPLLQLHLSMECSEGKKMQWTCESSFESLGLQIIF